MASKANVAVEKRIHEAFIQLSTEARELYLWSDIPEVFSAPNALEFHRSFVSYNRPVILRNGAGHWPAIDKWRDNNYLINRLGGGNKEVTVAITPNGFADAIIADGRFVMPHEEQMLFRDFVSIIEEPSKSTGVHYIQKQNSNLTEEISDLIDDICPFDWATEAFGKSPDAVNFWMGDQRAVTSTHKDPYENIYAVVRGYKDITLFPPTDLPWLPYKTCSQAIYVKNQDGSFDIKDLPEAGTVPWIAVDPQNPDLKKYPQYGNAHPINLRLNAGDVLYLPSFWFHHLKQSQGCIAVNWWYDMEFDVRYNYFNFLQSVVNINENLGDPP